MQLGVEAVVRVAATPTERRRSVAATHLATASFRLKHGRPAAFYSTQKWRRTFLNPGTCDHFCFRAAGSLLTYREHFETQRQATPNIPERDR